MAWNSRTYLNVILTVIAVLLLVSALQSPVRLGVSTTAQAANEAEKKYFADTVSAGQGPMVAATEKMAVANQEIARQVGAVAKSIDGVARSLTNLSLSQPAAPQK